METRFHSKVFIAYNFCMASENSWFHRVIAHHLLQFNTFQLVLAFNQQESYVLFLYDDIQWTTADRSGGENGLGGTPATVGLNSGDGVHYLIVQGSGSSEIADVEHATNVGMDGLFIFRTDTDIVAPAPCE